jgi:ribonuclease HI
MYYAVKVGRKVGIFTEPWNTIKTYVLGYKGAVFKKFKTLSEAEDYMGLSKTETDGTNVDYELVAMVYTDGSYKDDLMGYGVVYPQKGTCWYGSVPKQNKKSSNNIAELWAIKMAIENTKGRIVVCSDSMYAVKALSRLTQINTNVELIEEIFELMEGRDIVFTHVYGHSGNTYNEMCDKLADMGRENWIPVGSGRED